MPICPHDALTDLCRRCKDEAKLTRVRALLAAWDAVGGCEWSCHDELREALADA